MQDKLKHGHTKTCTLTSAVALFVIAKLEKTKMSINQQMDKQNVIYLYNEILYQH